MRFCIRRPVASAACGRDKLHLAQGWMPAASRPVAFRPSWRGGRIELSSVFASAPDGIRRRTWRASVRPRRRTRWHTRPLRGAVVFAGGFQSDQTTPCRPLKRLSRLWPEGRWRRASPVPDGRSFASSQSYKRRFGVVWRLAPWQCLARAPGHYSASVQASAARRMDLAHCGFFQPGWSVPRPRIWLASQDSASDPIAPKAEGTYKRC